MTTIAYVNGVMAADTQMTRGIEICLGARKIFRTQNYLVGVAGDYSNIPELEAFVNEYDMGPAGFSNVGDLVQNWEKAPSYGSGFNCLIVDRDGRIYYSSDSPPYEIPRSFEAIGTGSSFAIGAMAHGASAHRALQIACSLDIHTGGEIHTETFDETAEVHPIRV